MKGARRFGGEQKSQQTVRVVKRQHSFLAKQTLQNPAFKKKISREPQDYLFPYQV
jgi:hypothetical protein